MNLANKSFKDNKTGEVVKIVDSYQNIAITDKKERIDSNRLLDTRFYTEYVDPSTFFKSNETYNMFAEKIKSVDLSKIPMENENQPFESSSSIIPNNDGFNPSTQESAVVMYDPEDEKAELARKYGASLDTTAINKQNQAFAKILADDEGEVIKVDADKTQPVFSQPITQNQTEAVQRVKYEDPIITMFRNAKRNVDFSINLKVEGRIPRLDFIEMMEDSYNISMIEFLADEFTNDLLNNPDKLKMMVIKEIKNRVYSQQKKVEAKIDEVLPVEEKVDVVKPKTTRNRKKTT